MGADYTRYADDLIFSGGEDFARQGRKQHAAGLVLNEKPNIVAWVRFIHPGKEAKLRAIFEQIDWI